MKMLTVMTFATILTIVVSGLLVIASFDHIIRMVYSFWFLLPYLTVLMILFASSTIATAVLYIETDREMEINLLPLPLRHRH